MEVKIEKHFSDAVRDLRIKSYAKYKYNGVDKIDVVDSVEKWYINCYIDGEIVGSTRLVRHALPFQDHYDDVQVTYRDFELGRLCIDNKFNSIEKFQIMSEMAKKTIAICILKYCKTLFASAKCPNNFLYNKLVGFKEISEPKAYPPFDKGIYLLSLDFQEEYNKRKKNIFNLSEEFLNQIKMEIDYGY